MRTIWKNCFLILLTIVSLTACSTDNVNAPSGKVLSDEERQIVLTGQPNTRDLGGYANSEKRIVKTQILYRSGDFSQLTSDDLKKVSALDIKRIIDLRTPMEISNKPDKGIANITTYQLPLLSDEYLNDSGYMYEILTGGMKAEQYMLPVYKIDDQKISTWKIFFETIQTGVPVLFHDTTGKDRAGMTAALLLSALDVPKETIIKDYLLSNQYMATSIEQSIARIDASYGPGAGDKLRPILGVEREYIEVFFTDIENKYGSVDNFLTKILGVDKNQMKKLYLN